MIAVNVIMEHLLERAERICPELKDACIVRGPLNTLPRDEVAKVSRAAIALGKAIDELNKARGKV